MKCPKCGKPNAYSVALVGTYCAECYIKAHPEAPTLNIASGFAVPANPGGKVIDGAFSSAWTYPDVEMGGATYAQHVEWKPPTATEVMAKFSEMMAAGKMAASTTKPYYVPFAPHQPHRDEWGYDREVEKIGRRFERAMAQLDGFTK